MAYQRDETKPVMLQILHALEDLLAATDSEPSSSAAGWTTVSETITISSGTTITSSSGYLLPANAFILGVNAQVKTVLPGGVTWKMGTALIDDLFAEALQPGALATITKSMNQGHVSPGGPTIALAPFINVTAATVRITTSGDPGAATGKILVQTSYIQLPTPA